jgi:hypothetical protein
LSEAFSIARSPQLQYDPVLGPDNGLRFRSSSFRWRSPLFMPLDPFGAECPLLACSARECRQPLYRLQVGEEPGQLCHPRPVHEAYVRPNLRDQLRGCLHAGAPDVRDDRRADAIHYYLKAAGPQAALVALLADWSNRGMYSEVQSVMASTPSLVDDVLAGVPAGPDAEELKSEMARLGFQEQVPGIDEGHPAVIADALKRWGFANVRTLTDTFRMLVLDQERHGPRVRDARKAAANCLVNLSGDFWTDNFKELDRATQKVLGTFLAKDGLPLLERERIARELLRSKWVVPLDDRLRSLAESMIWDARYLRLEASLSSGNLGEFAQALDGWHRALDEADGEYESASRAAEERFLPLAQVAARSEQFLSDEVARVKRLRELVAIANSPQSDRHARKGASEEADRIRLKLGDHVGNSPAVTKLVHEAQSPWAAQRVRVRNASAAAVIALASVAVIVVALLSLTSCLRGPPQ